MVKDNRKKKNRKSKKYNYGHKYLEDLEISYYDTYHGLCMETNDKGHKDGRRQYWHEQRQIYGFDERKTWNMDYSMKQDLYETLMMYKETGGQVICLDYHKFTYKDKEYTQGELIDKILEGLKLDFKLGMYDKKRDNPEIAEKINDVWYIYALIQHCLWW